LKLIFLIVTRAVSLLGLSQRESWWEDAEVLILLISSLSPSASGPALMPITPGSGVRAPARSSIGMPRRTAALRARSKSLWAR
jgi:hypothetical protein